MSATHRRCVAVRACAVVLLALCACDVSGPAESSDPDEPPSGDGSVVIDLDDAIDASGLPYDCAIGSTGGDVTEVTADPEYVPLEPGGPIPIGGVGQAGLTAWVALRCTPASDGEPALEEPDVELILTNAFTAVVAPRKPAPKPTPLSCEDTTCDGFLQIEISHLAKLPELEGLTVRVDLRVLSADGELLGRDRTHGVLTQR